MYKNKGYERICMGANLEDEKKEFLTIGEKKDWDAICGKTPVSLDDFYRICDLMAVNELFRLLDYFTETNYNLVEMDVEEWKDLSGLELLPDELLEKFKK